MTSWSRPLAAFVISLALIAGACGDDDDGGDTTPAADPEFIELIQTQLTAIGCYDGPIDGLEGPETTEAILNFQRAQGLEEDGVVGAETEAALETAVEAGVENCSADGE